MIDVIRKLKRRGYIGDTVIWCKKDLAFIVHVYLGDMLHIRNNYKYIKNCKIQNECFIVAAAYSKNSEIIKYIYNCFKYNIDTSSRNSDGHTCLTIACKRGSLDVIKYLVEDLKLNVNNAFTVFNDSCLMQACLKNKLEVVKYLIEICGADVNYTKMNFFDCMSYLHPTNKHSGEIAAYLLESIDYKKRIGHIDVLRTSIPLMKNAKKINWQLSSAFNFFSIDMVIPIIKNVNPLILDHSVRCKAGIVDPYSDRFSIFKQYVDQLIEPLNRIDTKIDVSCESLSFAQLVRDDIDFSERDEFLFTHAKISYYGKRNIVYDCMDIFRDIFRDTKDIDVFDNVELGEGIDVSKNIINKYIFSCYTGWFNLNTVDRSDIIETLKFIDRYPTKYLSIDKLEKNIIMYHDKLNTPYDLYIKDISERYQLKKLYLDIKCKDLALRIKCG